MSLTALLLIFVAIILAAVVVGAIRFFLGKVGWVDAQIVQMGTYFVYIVLGLALLFILIKFVMGHVGNSNLTL